MNLCAYASNNPVNWVDPEGKSPLIITAAAAAVAIGVTAYAIYTIITSPQYNNVLDKKAAVDNAPNLEKFTEAFEDYKPSLGPAINQIRDTVNVLYETKPWEMTIGPKVDNPYAAPILVGTDALLQTIGHDINSAKKCP